MEGGHSKPQSRVCTGRRPEREKGRGGLAQPGGSPAGNLQPRGCFVIPWSIFHPPPLAFLQAGDDGARPHPSCDSACGTRGRELGVGEGAGLWASATCCPCSLLGGQESPARARHGQRNLRVLLVTGPSRDARGCRGWGALPPGMAPSLGVTWAVTSLVHRFATVPLSLQRSSCALGEVWEPRDG